MTLKTVLDTNVIVSAMLSPGGNAANILSSVLDGKIQICLSAPIMAEYEEVLLRPKFKFAPDRVRLVLDVLSEIGLTCEPSISSMPLPDEADRPFYDATRSENAILITGNLRHYPIEPFILTPREFVEKIQMLPSGYAK
jgi:putative PIN family toxin of toxin-antitoxin system